MPIIFAAVIALFLTFMSYSAKADTKLDKDTCEAVSVVAEAVALQYYIGTDNRKLIKWANTQEMGLRSIVIEVVKDAYGPSKYILRNPQAQGIELFKNKWHTFCHQQLK